MNNKKLLYNPLIIMGLIFTAIFTAVNLNRIVKAESIFGETDINKENMIAIATPGGLLGYSLVLLEQVPDGRPCWEENGNNPTFIDPLLLTYDDFSKDCKRGTDSNAFSIRLDNEELRSYLLRIVEDNDELLLVGRHIRVGTEPDIVIGRTKGMSDNSNHLLKIFLDPGWKFTKRTYDGETLSHTYISGDSSLIEQY